MNGLMIILGVVAGLGVLIAVVTALIIGVLFYKHSKKVKGKGLREVP